MLVEKMNHFTKSELQSLLMKQKKYAAKRGIIGSISLLLLIGASILTEKRMGFISEHRFIFSFLGLALLFTIVGFTIIPMFQHMRRIGLVCPHCGQLPDRYRSELALKNSKCEKCGQINIK